MADSDEYHDKSSKLGVKDRRWSVTGRVLGGQMIGRSGDVMCGLHHVRGDEEHEFLG
jgi:hypothetical protein